MRKGRCCQCPCHCLVSPGLIMVRRESRKDSRKIVCTVRATMHRSLVSVRGFVESLLETETDPDMFARLRAAESIGRPLGGDGFLVRIERLTKRRLKPDKRGPKPTGQQN